MSWWIWVAAAAAIAVLVEALLLTTAWILPRVHRKAPVGITIATWFIAALLLLTSVFLVFSFIYGAGSLPDSTKEPDWLRQVMVSTVPAAGILGAAVAVAVSLRRHALDNTEADRALDRDLRTRYTVAAEQLGHDKAPIRLAGVYALAALADDWKMISNHSDTQTCIDLLCAYLRVPAAHHHALDNAADYTLTPDDMAEVEVRSSIISAIAARLRPGSKGKPPTWQGHTFNLTGARLEAHANFRNIQVTNGTTINFSSAIFGDDARFDGATFGRRANFVGATFGDGTHFDGAIFGDQAIFVGAIFGDGTYFRRATFGDLAYFDGAIFGDDARFDGATFGDQAIFVRATFGHLSYFEKATFGDGTHFDEAIFGDGTYFRRATFGDLAYFDKATFGDGTHFRRATFGDDARFDGTTFRDKPDFTGATAAGRDFNPTSDAP